MNQHDFSKFHALWLNAHAMSSSNQQPIDNTIMAVFDVLVEYPLHAIEFAIKHHAKQSRFAPTPHDIVAVLTVREKRLSADEAWAEIPKDENKTVVWTEEMAQAYGLASTLWAEGDKIAARMAFKAAYERLCNEAVILKKPCVWRVSIGYDREGVKPVLLAAVQKGRITAEEMAKRLPPSMDGGLIGKLITGKVSDLPENEKNLKARWQGLKQALVEGNRIMAVAEEKINAERVQKRLEIELSREQSCVWAGLQQKH
jgi:hypothetical protein